MSRYGSALLLPRWLLYRVKSEPELCLLLVLGGTGGWARRGKQGDEYRRTGMEAWSWIYLDVSVKTRGLVGVVVYVVIWGSSLHEREVS
jgi:hypothetical protein